MRPWTHDQVLELPVIVPLVIGGQVYGMSRSRVHDRRAAGQLPFEVVQIGAQYFVTRAALLSSLGIDPAATPGKEGEPASDKTGPATTATAAERTTTDDPDGATTLRLA